MQTVDLIGKEAQGNSSIIEQLNALRATLDSIEEKVEPTPPPVPKTFDMAAFYASPFYKLALDLQREAEAFDDYLSNFWHRVWSAAKSPVAAKNLEAWEKATDDLQSAWYDQILALRSSVKSVAHFSKYMATTVSIACDCEEQVLAKAAAAQPDPLLSGKEACHE